MSYTMVICEGKNNSKSFQNPSSKVIEQAIGALIPAEYRFVILEADPPVEKCAYVQTLIEREGRFKGQYLVEARYEFAGYFKHYRTHSRDAGEVKRLFQKFADGVAPNVAGWDDFSERMDEITS